MKVAPRLTLHAKGEFMDISKKIAELKKKSGFVENVGMVLAHNGIVRGRSRDGQLVKSLQVQTDYARIEKLQAKYSQEQGIFAIEVEAKEGEFLPGEDLLFIVVAGDIRPNVKRVLVELLEDIKTTCFVKKEILV